MRVSPSDPGSAGALFTREDRATLDGITVMKGLGHDRMRFRRDVGGVWRIGQLRLLHDDREEFPGFIHGRRVCTTPAFDEG